MAWRLSFWKTLLLVFSVLFMIAGAALIWASFRYAEDLEILTFVPFVLGTYIGFLGLVNFLFGALRKRVPDSGRGVLGFALVSFFAATPIGYFVLFYGGLFALTSMYQVVDNLGDSLAFDPAAVIYFGVVIVFFLLGTATAGVVVLFAEWVYRLVQRQMAASRAARESAQELSGS